MASRGRPVAADPDNPGRTVSQPPLNRGGEELEPFYKPTADDHRRIVEEKGKDLLEVLDRGDLGGALDRVIFLLNKHREGLEDGEAVELVKLRKSLEQVTRWRARVELRRRQSAAQRELEAATQALQVLGD